MSETPDQQERTTRLTLPLPPSPNRKASHRMVAHRQQREYQWRCWVAALEQERPPAEPPERVRIRATLYVKQRRDEDNADASLKWVLDALRQKQASRKWREGLYEDRGYFVDDDPARCTVEKVQQEIDRARPRLELTIEELTPTMEDE